MTQTKRIRNPSLARLHIALDVVAQLLSKALVASYGRVFGDNIRYKILDARSSASGETFLSTIVKPESSCEVCAKGALILSHTLRFNELTINDLASMEKCDIAHKLPEFPKRMMAEIEILFEGRVYDWDRPLFSGENIKTLMDYATKNLRDLGSTDRLIHIMGLLIKNRGHFVLLGKLPKK